MGEGLEFADKAVSGTKRDRAGLNDLVEAAREGRFEVFYVFSLSRLARESVITMPLLKKLVHNFGVRFVSLSEGIDSAQESWDMVASMLSLQHERYIKDLSDNVFRGQEGAILANRSVGDYCFGYSSVPIPGADATRRSRHAKPPKEYIIDPVTSRWVIRMFDWYVVEKRPIAWIVRELNRLGAPKDHRSSTPDWHHDYVRGYLANRKFIGIWPWGEKQNFRDPLTGDVSQEARPVDECEKWVRHFPELQIISDEIFAKAQERLTKNKATFADHRKSEGELTGSCEGIDHRARRHLLSGLMECSECGARLNVGGTHGKYLFCPKYKRGICSCRTQLLMTRAERLILEAVGSRILINPAWTAAVVEAAHKAVKDRTAKSPDELAACERQLAEIERRIGNLIDKVESGTSDADIDQRLAERRTERRELLQRLETLRRANAAVQDLPTEEWVRDQLTRLWDVMGSSTPAAAEALRNLLGGRVLLTEIRREGRSRHHLQGRFTIEVGGLTRALLAEAESTAPADSDVLQEDVVIDFVEPDDQLEAANRVKELADQNLPFNEIADRIGCCRANITRLWKLWHTSRGLEVPDGRAQRAARAENASSRSITIVEKP
jgi:hypothetical protein